MLNATVSEQEIERLLTGSPGGNGALSDLAPFVEMMRAYESYIPSDHIVDRLASEAAALARASRSTVSAGRRSQPRPRLTWRALTPRIATAALSIVVLAGITGVAAAADAASPGHGLYGLDRALERIGIGAGSTGERLEEANQLLTEGQTLQALEHAAEAVEGAAAAKAALDIAIDRVETAANENSAAVQEKVGALLNYMSENIGADSGVDGREFGQGIADIARGIAPASESGDPVPTHRPAPVNQNQPDEGEHPGNGNQGSTNQGTNSGNSDPPGSGGSPGNQNSGNGNNPGTGSNQGGNTDSSGQSGASGNGSGPPPGSPSETAPGRGNRP
jgi:hypothetical protein